MATQCHSRGVEILVDGAHALGALPISMRDIGADYYVSNAHKWLCNPKGCGFLYVRTSLQRKVRPLVVSHGYDSGFSSSYIWSGLKDYSPFLALNTVLEFWQCCGPDKIRHYITTTAREAGEALVKSWGTELLANSSMFGSMVLVALPDAVGWTWSPEHGTFTGPFDYSHAELLQDKLYHNHQIEAPVKAIQGRLYVRISAHIYNTAQDYAKLAAAVNEINTQKLSMSG
ncbi:Probable L-cysteine desulfhydrase, chloroplastic [Geodia barretti]|uniref:Probable L-cysteine desulfhydrase, chloroplastic n=1 Tax=Geodia barretti TaxID=519541 RepID=A0AA35XLY3_GEOBA|nr:Probable L-cysteine desulfhydrase, chloroplastic [Geodia barretti]